MWPLYAECRWRWPWALLSAAAECGCHLSAGLTAAAAQRCGLISARSVSSAACGVLVERPLPALGGTVPSSFTRKQCVLFLLGNKILSGVFSSLIFNLSFHLDLNFLLKGLVATNSTGVFLISHRLPALDGKPPPLGVCGNADRGNLSVPGPGWFLLVACPVHIQTSSALSLYLPSRWPPSPRPVDVDVRSCAFHSIS